MSLVFYNYPPGKANIGVSYLNVDVVGEGLAARRRGMATLIDHMVPPFKRRIGRSFTDLLALQPGIVPVTTQQPNSIVMAGASEPFNRPVPLIRVINRSAVSARMPTASW